MLIRALLKTSYGYVNQIEPKHSLLTHNLPHVCFAILIVTSCVIFYTSVPAFADGYPPYWDDSTGAVHFKVLPWPTDAEFASQYYTHQGIPIIDKRIADPSNGGRAPQNYANVSSSCTSGSPDQVTPSVAWYFNSDSGKPSPEPTLFFRWLVEQIPNTYATGPLTQPYSNVDPFFAAQWTVLIDIDGDGYREFAVNIDGNSGNPAEPVDVMKSIYSDTRSQSLDYENDPQIYSLFHQPTAFVYDSYGAGDPYLAYDEYILNFRNSLNPIPVWPNGSAETVWDYGSTRVRNMSNDYCNEFIVDYQIPLDMLDATSVGGPRVTEFTPMCLAFVTANSNQDPLQKDIAFDGTMTFTPENCVPCGDLITLAGGVIPQPIVTEVTSTGCGPTTFSARVRDAINADCTDTLAGVTFYIFYDKNANGDDDDAGESWTSIGAATVSSTDPSLWTITYDTSSLNSGQYLVGVRAQDTDSTVHVTWSFLTQAEVDAGTPPASAGQYANSTPEPGVVMDLFLNSCGESATLTESVSPSYTAAGGVVTFTITVTNNTSSAFNLTSITNALPSGFSYQFSAPPAGAGPEGGSLAASIATRPVDGATGNVTWTFNPGTTIAAGTSATLTFTAQAAPDTGTYTSSASAVTDDPDWGNLASNSVDIGVGAPQLTIAKRPSVYSAVPGDTVTYTITYSNDSPVSTTGVVITDVLPAGLNFVAAGSGGTYDPATRTITWNLGDLASGEGPYTVTYQVIVTQGAAVRTENTATIDSNETAPATAKTAIYVPSPLQIAKTADKALVDPRGVSPANQVTYTITYRNTGTTALTGTTITDTTMPGFTYSACTGGCTTAEPSGDGYGNDNGTCETGEPCTVTWSIGNLAAGASGSVTLTLTVTNPYSEMTNPATNTAVIDTNETGPLEDSASVVIRDYDCGATKDRYYFHDLDASALPAPWTGVAPGTPLPTTITRDYANMTAPVSPTAIDLTVNITDDSEMELAQFYMDPPLDRPSGFSIAGTVDMQAYMSKNAGGKVNIICYLYDYDPDTGESVQIGSQAADSGAGLRDNYLLTFSITPTGIVREGNLLMWRFTTQRVSSYAGPVTFHYDSSATTGTQAGRSFGDVCFAPLSVTMEKTVDKLEASPGQTLAYTMTFTNSGQQSVSGTTIVDTLPTGLTFNSATMNGTAMTSNCPTPGLNQYCASGQLYTFEAHTSGAAAGVLAGGGTGTLVINVTINNPLAPEITTLTNIARLYNDSTDPVEDDATTDITHTPTPDVFMQKSADKTLLNPGDTVTYTVTVVNVGDATANNIVVSDTIPSDAYFTYVAGSIAGGNSRSDAGLPTLTWTINSLTSGSTATLTFRMLVASSGVPPGVTYKNNFASATEATTSPPNSNTVTVAITTNANLSVTKTVSSPVYTANVGTGNGATKVFNATFPNIPVQVGSVEVFVAGTQVGSDSGTGIIIGDGLTASTINYTTGALHLEFLTAPANGAAITATYRQELAPGATVQYSITVTSNGGSTATGVVVYDPIPTEASYVAGTLLYDGAAQTDQSGDDNAYYDGVANRVVFTPGDMAVDTSHTLKFSVVLDSAFADGSTTVTNTATGQATNTASKSASASVVVTTSPNLTLSKSAPPLVPYPLAVLNGNHTATTTLTLTNPPGSRYFNAGDLIYINGVVRTVTSVLSATQVTVDSAITAGSGTQVLPVIKYNLYYANTGTASATNVSIKDILTTSPANLNYISATPTPTSAPAFNTNGILTWDLGTLAPGSVGTITVYTRPTATGTYSNTATMSASNVPNFASNTVNTTVGALELDKYTSTPSVVNNPADGADYATYVIRVRNPFTATTALGVQVTDYLPQGFTYASTTSIVFNPLACGSRPSTVNPTVGDTNPTWGTWIIGGANCTLTITFTALIAPTVNAGTYQNAVTATSTNLNVLPFDELITTAEDVTVTIPGDISVSKAIVQGPVPCIQGTCVDYLVTIRNLGTVAATNITVTDTDTDYLTYPPANLAYVSDAPSAGTFNSGTGVWSIPGPIAAGTSATLSLRFSITSFVTTINNCVSRTASTPADTNNGNDKYCVSLIPTFITLSSFYGYNENGQMVIEWTTSSEIDTAGFYLFRLDESTGRYKQINRNLLPAILISPQGGIYSLIDNGASLKKSNTYILVEIEGKGARNTYGPFTIIAEGGNAVENKYSSNPVTPETFLNDKNIRKPDGPEQRHTSRITRYIDGDGTIVITSKRSKSSGESGVFAVDEVSNYTRSVKVISAEKKARIDVKKIENEKNKLLKKMRKGNMVKISISKEGLYYIDSAEISSLLGLSQDEVKHLIKAGNLAMSSQGRNVAYIPPSDNSGIYFYGQGIDSIYTEENIYWLYKGNGLQMEYTEGEGQEPAGYRAFTETIHAEKDKFFLASPSLDPETDYWFWDYIVGGNPSMGTKTFNIQAYDSANTSSAATMTARLYGLTNTGVNNDHHAVISLNGTIIGEDRWKGAEEKIITLSFSQGLLYNGANTIEVKGLLDTGAPYSVFYVDSFDLSYQRLYKANGDSLIFRAEDTQPLTIYGFTNPDILVFDITEPNKPVLNFATTIDGTKGNFSVSFKPYSQNAQYLVITANASVMDLNAWADNPSNLSSPNNRADYIVITTEELAAAAQALTDYRSSQGLNTMVVILEDILDEFNFGIYSPKAIRDFLMYAHNNWKKAPAYVVLAGEGTYDYKNNQGYGDNLVPTNIVRTPLGLFPSDNRFVDFDGDRMPDIAIGRLPVLTSEELQGVISKVTTYENTAGNRIVMLSDNPDDGGNFPADSDEIASLVPAGYHVRKICLSDYQKDYVRKLLFNEINIGTILLNYIGHGGVDRLAHEGILRTADISFLENAGRPYVMSAMTCMVGQFGLPGYDSLSEALLLKKDGGAVAVWAPSGLSFNSLSKKLDESFFNALFTERKKVLGDSIIEAFRDYSNQGGIDFIMDIYNLQGDPALKMW